MDFSLASRVARENPGSVLTRDASGEFIVMLPDGDVLLTPENVEHYRKLGGREDRKAWILNRARSGSFSGAMLQRILDSASALGFSREEFQFLKKECAMRSKELPLWPPCIVLHWPDDLPEDYRDHAYALLSTLPEMEREAWRANMNSYAERLNAMMERGLAISPHPTPLEDGIVSEMLF